VTPGVNKFLT